jgi:N-acyl homoserine lactone hydrolase
MECAVKIHAIQTGSVRIKTAQVEGRGTGPLRMLGIFMDPDWSDWAPTFAWAIEHDEGVIVVDTGQAAHLLESGRSIHPYARWEVRFRIEPEQEVGPQLAALGIAPRDVRQVVLTHLHMDHDAGIKHFPHSEILAARGEIARAEGLMGRIRGYLPQRWPSWFDPTPLDLGDGPLGPFAASKRLTRSGDVVAVATPGHTADHLSVLVQDGGVSYLLAGDTSYNEALMIAGKVDGVSPDAGVSAATLSAIRQYALAHPTVYLPTHDPDSGARFAARTTVPRASLEAARPTGIA